MEGKLRSSISSNFKLHGLTLRSDASRYLVEVLSPVAQKERNKWIDKIIEIVHKQSLSSSLISKGICETAVKECNAEQEDDSTSILNVIDAFSVPRYTFVKERKKFLSDSALGKPPPNLHGSAEDKATMFRERYNILHQRTLHHDIFTPPVLGSIEADSSKFQLKLVEYMVGSTNKLPNVLVLGMLVQLKEGKWYLEDPTGVVQVDISQAEFQGGLFTENSFVLAEGWFEDGIFYIDGFGLPPPEKSEITRSFFGNINFFGGPATVQVKASERLKILERENTEAMFVFLSDVWLDNERVMKKLDILFRGYSLYPPTAIVFCGNFLSSSKVLSHSKLLKECFTKLGSVLANYPSLINSTQLIFVPGPNDPGHATILPRPALPNSITEQFRKKVPGAVFTSNPCRIQYCTQEMVVFREEIVTKMCRNCVRFPKEGDIPNHFAKSLISQGHLCPLPPHVCPVYWAYDCSLRLYPLPDVIIAADKFDPFSTKAMQVNVINPGSFGRTDFGFKVYYPATKEVQDSRVPENESDLAEESQIETDADSQMLVDSTTLDNSEALLVDTEPSEASEPH